MTIATLILNRRRIARWLVHSGEMLIECIEVWVMAVCLYVVATLFLESFPG